jgi:hypothetical protein
MISFNNCTPSMNRMNLLMRSNDHGRNPLKRRNLSHSPNKSDGSPPPLRSSSSSSPQSIEQKEERYLPLRSRSHTPTPYRSLHGNKAPARSNSRRSFFKAHARTSSQSSSSNNSSNSSLAFHSSNSSIRVSLDDVSVPSLSDAKIVSSRRALMRRTTRSTRSLDKDEESHRYIKHSKLQQQGQGRLDGTEWLGDQIHQIEVPTSTDYLAAVGDCFSHVGQALVSIVALAWITFRPFFHFLLILLLVFPRHCFNFSLASSESFYVESSMPTTQTMRRMSSRRVGSTRNFAR